jgi:hypothetical protein
MISFHQKFLLSILYVQCLALAAKSVSADPFVSPLTKFAVHFKQVAHVRFQWPGKTLDEISHVKYLITFVNRKDSTACQCEYADVYGHAEDDKPAEIAAIFESFIWSPKEDFVMLPEESWRCAPSSPYQKAICLNNQLGWATAILHMDIKVWADHFRIIGEIHDDCDYRVVMFNGKTGQHEILRQGDTYPIGYEIERVNPPMVVIRKVLNNCATDSDVERFVEGCETFDYKSMKSEKAACGK